MKLKILFYCILFSFTFAASIISQIKIYERIEKQADSVVATKYNSETRRIIPLNGEWEVSFEEHEFSKLYVPLSYTFNGNAVFKKSFEIADSLLVNNSFLLVAEGISYSANIRINNRFVLQHIGSYTPITIILDESLLQNKNIIEITINNVLDNSTTLPFANQTNFGKVYGGINKDIYLVVMPKLSVLGTNVDYEIQTDNNIKLLISTSINSGNLAEMKKTYKDFYLHTEILSSKGEKVFETQKQKFQIDDYQLINVNSEIVLRNPALWSPQNPNLYRIRNVISANNNIIDVESVETGFTQVSFNQNTLIINGEKTALYGTSYYEDSPLYGDALSYELIEKDLMKIKEIGLNCIRVPGRTAHPYIVTLCNKLGLFLLQDIPFNNVPEKFLGDSKYLQQALDNLEDIIKRDKNSPCILAWGVGNNFDVTSNYAIQYLQKAKELVTQIDNKRKIYYSAWYTPKDICNQYSDIVGINFNEPDYMKVISTLQTINEKQTYKVPYFIASYGKTINNINRNGAADKYSVEYQMKYISEIFKIVTSSSFCNIIDAYADWTSETPLNFPLNPNPFLKTNGIFEADRTPKPTANLVKRLIANQGFQKIPEGSGDKMYTDKDFTFLIAGFIGIGTFFIILGRGSTIKNSLIRSFITPKNFTLQIKEQSFIPPVTNIALDILTSFGLSIFFASVIYLYRDSDIMDILFGNIFGNSELKIYVSDLINSPEKLVFALASLLFILSHSLTLFLYILNLTAKKHVKFNTLYTIKVWSYNSLLIFIFLGTIIYKLGYQNGSYVYYTVLLYIILLIFSTFKLINGLRTLFETGIIKTYSLGLLFATLSLLLLFGYFYFTKFTFNLAGLLLNYQ
ncbi:MAG: glycoside hydrolase family 2 protein [Ignavibacteria bacterium]